MILKKKFFLLLKALKSQKGQTINLAKNYPIISDVKNLINQNKEIKLNNKKNSKSLDLGCGINPKNPFNAENIFGIDIRNDLKKSIKSADLSVEKIPFDNETFDFVTAFDFIEHIPRSIFLGDKTIYPFLDLMNEIYRVLKPNGYFLHSTPAYPSKEAFMDPTHVNIITEDTFPKYFCRPNIWAKEYGYGFKGDFKLISQGWIRYAWLVSLMQAKK